MAVTTRGERRIVTALIADVVGSTAIGEQLGPERSKLLIDEVVRLMAEQVRRYEGTVAQLVGDEMLAVVPDADEVEHALDRIVISEAMSALTPEHRAVIVETYYRGKSVADAAESLGVSETQLDQLIAARRNPAMNPPARITVGKTTGLHLSWFVYRGAGKVTFSPDQVKPWEDTRAGMNSPWAPLWTPPRMPADGKVVAQATFSEPGTYVLKALADDGGLTGYQDLTVTVTK